MSSYKKLIDTVIQRESGIVGKSGVEKLLEDMGLELNESGKLTSLDESNGKEILDDLMKRFLDRYGMISIIGCRIEVRKIARRYSLELPEIFK
ncbi:MAG: hypothetical protein OEZ36_12570 [Spirochaetota bacterium]|nr:hypothetical protein [Spirochaetota bacterium]